MPITETLLKIVMAGGGLDLRNAQITSENAAKLATAAARSGARLTFNGSPYIADTMVKIAVAGKGNVTFAF